MILQIESYVGVTYVKIEYNGILAHKWISNISLLSQVVIIK